MRHLIAQLDLPVPPSVNGIWRVARGRVIKSANYRKWLVEATVAEAQQGAKPKKPPEKKVKILIEVIPGKGFRPDRDLDNVPKPIMDFLVQSGYLIDDSCKFIREITVRLIEEPAQNGYVTVSIIG